LELRTLIIFKQTLYTKIILFPCVKYEFYKIYSTS